MKNKLWYFDGTAVAKKLDSYKKGPVFLEKSQKKAHVSCIFTKGPSSDGVIHKC